MKKQQILFASALALTLALGACTNDNEPQVVDLTKPISLDFGLEATTKVAIENPIGFDNGDAVGVYLATSDDQTQAAINAGQPVNNVQFQLNGGTWDGVIYWQNTAQWHTLYAYYPYDAALDGTQTTKAVSVQADQYSNNGQAYKAADYLWGVNRPVMATVSSQTIQLKHRMARIVVKLSCGDDMAPEELQAIAPSLKLLGTNIPTQGTFEVKDGQKVFTDKVLNGDTGIQQSLWNIGASNNNFTLIFPYDWFVKVLNVPEVETMTEEARANGWFPDAAKVPKLDFAQQEQEKLLLATLNDYVAQMHEQFVYGKLDVDANWDQYVAEVHAKGLDDLLALYNAA